MAKKEKMVTIVRPTYYTAFSCLGPACTDNCCHDWMITIDKKHYLQYMGVPDAKFHEQCKQAILRNRKNTSDADYAQMHLQSNRCLFQDPDGGCGIYRRLGEDSLSDTCTVYPRVQHAIGTDTWERSLTLSCREAARLAMLTGKPLEFETVTVPVDPSDRLAAMAGKAQMDESTPHFAYIQTVRKACIRMMQLRALPLRERIVGMGLMLRSADRAMREGKEQAMPALLDAFLTQTAESGVIAQLFEKLPNDPGMYRWAILLPSKHLLSTERRTEKLEMWQTVGPYCTQTGATTFEVGDRAHDFILSRAREVGDPFIARHAQAIENYFVNYIFSSLFPFTYIKEQCSPEYHAVILAEQYAMLRVLLGTMPEQEGESEDDRLVRLIAILAHITQHRNLGRDVKNYAKQKEGLDSLAYAAFYLS